MWYSCVGQMISEKTMITMRRTTRYSSIARCGLGHIYRQIQNLREHRQCQVSVLCTLHMHNSDFIRNLICRQAPALALCGAGIGISKVFSEHGIAGRGAAL